MIGWISLVEVSSPLFRAKSTAFASIIQSASGVLFVSLGHPCTILEFFLIFLLELYGAAHVV